MSVSSRASATIGRVVDWLGLSSRMEQSPDDFRFFGLCAARWTTRWPKVAMADIPTGEIESYFVERTHKDCPHEDLKQEHQLLSVLFGLARNKGWVNESSIRTIPLPEPISYGTPVMWTAPEQRRILSTCEREKSQPNQAHSFVAPPPVQARSLRNWTPPRYPHPLVLMALKTGLRVGNLLYLEWDHLNLDGGRIVLPATETRRGDRLVVKLVEPVVTALTALQRQRRYRHKPTKYVLDAVDMPRKVSSRHRTDSCRLSGRPH